MVLAGGNMLRGDTEPNQIVFEFSTRIGKYLHEPIVSANKQLRAVDVGSDGSKLIVEGGNLSRTMVRDVDPLDRGVKTARDEVVPGGGQTQINHT